MVITEKWKKQLEENEKKLATLQHRREITSMTPKESGYVRELDRKISRLKRLIKGLEKVIQENDR